MNVLEKSLVLVVEPEPMTRSGLVQFLSKQEVFQVCAAVDGPAGAREQCTRWRPRLVVMDCLMPGGLSFLKELPRWSPGARVVCFTASREPVAVQRVLQAGAHGYVTRLDAPEALLEALRTVLAGRHYAGPEAAETLLGSLARGGLEVATSDAALLSDRELEVFRLTGQGLSARRVAERLRLSVKTVETHRERIKLKLQLANGAELQQRAALYHQLERQPLA